MILTNDNIMNNFIYKDNESDIVISIIGNSLVKDKIFNNLCGFNKYSRKSISYGKFNYNDSDYILINLPNSKKESFNYDFNFSDSLITIIVLDDIKNNMSLLLDTLQFNNNVILCLSSEDIEISVLEKILNIPVILIDNKNGLYKLIKEIDKHNYECNLSNEIIYDELVELSIRKIKKYLDSRIDYINTRWLAIKLLTTNEIIKSINKYLNYDIGCDNILIDLINSERNKFEDINKLVCNKIVSIGNKVYEKCKI